MTINRNNKCPCGSGLKYKKCCLNRTKETKAPVLEKDFKILVELRPSLTHGLGVFAIQDIPAFTKVCLYDGEDLPDNKIEEDSVYLMSHPIKCNCVRQGYTKDNLRREYGIGQFINDFCMPELDLRQSYSLRQLKKICNKYEKKSMLNANVAFKDDDFWFYSVRNIPKGEELLYTYGRYYWLSDAKHKNLHILDTYRFHFATKTIRKLTLEDISDSDSETEDPTLQIEDLQPLD